MNKYLDLGDTVVLYESPNRLERLLNTVKEIDEDINIFLAKDISKIREESICGCPDDILAILSERNFSNNPHGEYVCVLHREI